MPGCISSSYNYEDDDGLNAPAVQALWFATLYGWPVSDGLTGRLARLSALRDRVGRNRVTARAVREGHTPFAA